MATLEKIRETRRINLKALIDSQYKNAAAFIRETNINQGQLSALLRGEKTFGEVVARNIEDRAGLPAGWLDNESQTEVMHIKMLAPSTQYSPKFSMFTPKHPITQEKLICINFIEKITYSY